MRPVTKNINRPPAHLIANNLHAVINLADPKHKDKIRQYIYGHPTVVAKLKSIYSHKCAYCESYEPEPEIDHYRPKNGVTGLPHPGYYWLCYEWSNLIPACHDCNKQGSKGNHFPVEGVRVTGPNMVLGVIDLAGNILTSHPLSVTEVPLLLNPEFPGFDPYQYFKIDSIGLYEPRALHPLSIEFKRAKETIDKIRLNRDKLLLGVRKRAIRYYMGRVKIILYMYLHGDITPVQYETFFLELLKELNEKKRVTLISEYWFFWDYFLRNFKFFLSQYFKGRFRQGLFNTYDNLIISL